MSPEISEAALPRAPAVGCAPSVLPAFVIIGAAKSASTWLHLALRQHPAIYMPGNETAFFDDAFYRQNDLGPLFAELQAVPVGALVGIKCPNYLCTPQCAPRLAEHLPHARLIAILRNPVDRAISQFYHLMRSGQIPRVPADVALQRYLSGRFDPPYTQSLVLEFGRYARGLANYQRWFPPEQLLILTDLDMRNGSVEVFKRVCRFLAIEDSFVPLNISMPRNQGAYFLPFLSLIQAMNQYGQPCDPATGRAVLRPGFMGSSARRLALLVSRLSAATRLFVRTQEPAVSRKTRAALLEFYLPDILELEALTHLDLSPWKVLHHS